MVLNSGKKTLLYHIIELIAEYSSHKDWQFKSAYIALKGSECINSTQCFM